MKICKCCHKTVDRQPLFRLKDMPRSAQGFPDRNHLKEDEGDELALYQCPYCGLVQLFCTPVSYYREVIRATGVSEEMKKFRKKQFQSFAEEYRLFDKKIVEFGCGNGDFLEIWKEINLPNVTGLEYGEKAVSACRNKGLNVIKGYPDSDKMLIEGGPFDAFYIMNFLEHAPNPSSFLTVIAGNLRENGVGIVEVPNSDMIIREGLYSELISDHLMYFTAETLRNLLSINGFEVIKCQVIWYDYIISAVVRKRSPLQGKGFQENYDEMNRMVSDYLKRKAETGKTAVWGAGHQAIANMAILEIRDYISYVIDSAPFKQNKYTPVSHIPIVSPDILDGGEIKTVLIMAGSYSDEISSIIRKKYKNVQAAILRQQTIEEVQ